VTNRCRYDRDTTTYLRPDDTPCRTDDYGDPTHHCTAKKGCANHVAENEQTCARCIGRTRQDLTRTAQLAKLMMAAAMSAGVNSEAANLAGPAADYATFSARRRIDKEWIYGHIPAAKVERAMRSLLADDDEHHPLNVLGRWDLMLREHHGHPSDEVVTVDNAAAYIARHLPRIAQDPDQDFPQLARELRKCRNHLETVLANSQRPERGAPCPECTNEANGVGPRLIRDYGHWCLDDGCERIHYLDDSGDTWSCPRNPAHQWTHDAYTNWIEERKIS
jgi:hypothetical protein